MKITQDMREYAESEEDRWAGRWGVGMKEKTEESIEKGSEIYMKA